MADKKKATPAAQSANKAATSGDAKHARTAGRKAKNIAANEARRQANIDKVNMLALQPIKVPVTKVVKEGRGKNAKERMVTIARELTPAERLRRFEREERERRAQAAQDELLGDIENRLVTCDYEPVKR